jgi:hypothetical protein
MIEGQLASSLVEHYAAYITGCLAEWYWTLASKHEVLETVMEQTGSPLFTPRVCVHIHIWAVSLRKWL